MKDGVICIVFWSIGIYYILHTKYIKFVSTNTVFA